MDEATFTIKPDEYEPDLFNDMSVHEEITVGSSEHVGGHAGVDQDYINNVPSNIVAPPSQNINIINSSLLPQQDMKQNKPKFIYLKQSINTAGKPLRLPPNVRVIPLSKLQNNDKVFQSIRTFGNNASIQRVVTPATLRNGTGGQQIQVTKLNNFNLSKLQGSGQKFIINKPNGGTYRNLTPLVSLQSNSTSFVNTQHQNTIIQPLSASQVSQSALKLEPGDSGFYNLTGGNGPTRYYPRMHSPDKDSLDGSQEMTNVYKTNGLRKYARSVCDKVKEKGTTTYSEVADELVHEYAAEHPMIPAAQLHYIQKNIRRRVYDALNVLMALKVLEKEKKEIKWKGLPVNLLEECRQLEDEKSRKTEILAQRVEELSELVLQLISYKNLVGRNKQKEKEGSAVPINERIKLPFLVITTNNSTVIDCNISSEKLEYMFTFDQPFEMQDEFQTLKHSGFTLRLGSSQCTESQYKRCLELVPNTLRFYVEALYQQRPAIVPDFLTLHRRNHLSHQRSTPNIKVSKNNLTSSQVMGSSGGVIGGSASSSVIGQSSNQYWMTGGGGSKRYSIPSSSVVGAAGVNNNGVLQMQSQPSNIINHMVHHASSSTLVPHGGNQSSVIHQHHNSQLQHHQTHQYHSYDQDIEVMDEDTEFHSDEDDEEDEDDE